MVVEDVGDLVTQAIDRVNLALESYIGISDLDLGMLTGRAVSALTESCEETSLH